MVLWCVEKLVGGASALTSFNTTVLPTAYTCGIGSVQWLAAISTVGFEPIRRRLSTLCAPR